MLNTYMRVNWGEKHEWITLPHVETEKQLKFVLQSACICINPSNKQEYSIQIYTLHVIIQNEVSWLNVKNMNFTFRYSGIQSYMEKMI